MLYCILTCERDTAWQLNLPKSAPECILRDKPCFQVHYDTDLGIKLIKMHRGEIIDCNISVLKGPCEHICSKEDNQLNRKTIEEMIKTQLSLMRCYSLRIS